MNDTDQQLLSANQRINLMTYASAVATPHRTPERICEIYDQLEEFIAYHCDLPESVEAMMAAMGQQHRNRAGGVDPYFERVKEFTGPVLEMYRRLYR